MAALTFHNHTPEVIVNNGKAVTTSLAVAAYFQKTHDNVLKKIRSVIAECEEEYRLVNFNETSYTRENPNGGAGISTPMFELTRDAFVLIVMGFTGKKALQWKIDYINAFNKMEAALSGAVQAVNSITQEEKDAYNINALVTHYMVMFDAWRYQIEPALRKIESPLAGRLHDRFGDGYIFLKTVEKSLNGKLLPGQSARIR
ncbi:Rha family transcriptional regulator [Citrobacter koseri]|uniref:Rha family transcriptional regulator n=1 Tax=Citrobacter koseri TaxID=545 RepID=UPI0019087EE5|nr:Rha family transcriptional regulator [Citrobacter koseri]MBJ9121008.1 Rha family transcriptional regulator [Citrobacter koseri]